jgi:phage FluMu protein gp41
LKEGYTPDERIYIGKASKTGPLAAASDSLYSMEKALKQLDRVIDSNPDISAKSVIKMVLKTLNDIKAKQKGGDPLMQGDFSMNEDTNRIVEEAQSAESTDDFEYFVKKGLKSGEFAYITPKSKVVVGNQVVTKYNGTFGEIVKIVGDKYIIASDAYGDKSKLGRKNLEKYYLLVIK